MTNIPRSNPQAPTNNFGNNRKNSRGKNNSNFTRNFNSHHPSNQTPLPSLSKKVMNSATFFVDTGTFIKKVSEGILPESATSKNNSDIAEVEEEKKEREKILKEMINNNGEGGNEAELMTMLELNDQINNLRLDKLKMKLKEKNLEKKIPEITEPPLSQSQNQSI